MGGWRLNLWITNSFTEYYDKFKKMVVNNESWRWRGGEGRGGGKQYVGEWVYIK